MGTLKPRARSKGKPLTFAEKPLTHSFKADISRIIKYAPAEIIGREAETKLLNDVWEQAVRGETKRPLAVDGLRRANQQHYLPHGLLSRAWQRFLTGAHTGPDSAQEDLDEAWEIAERGPMRLFMADIHLYRVRLFHGVKPYPWATDADSNARGPKDDLAAARKLIEQCGYWRRKEELEDAEEAARHW